MKSTGKKHVEAYKTLRLVPLKGAYFPLIQHNEQVTLKILATNHQNQDFFYPSRATEQGRSKLIAKISIIKYFNNLYMKYSKAII